MSAENIRSRVDRILAAAESSGAPPSTFEVSIETIRRTRAHLPQTSTEAIARLRNAAGETADRLLAKSVCAPRSCSEKVIAYGRRF